MILGFLLVALVVAVLLMAVITNSKPRRHTTRGSSHSGSRSGVPQLSREQIAIRWQTIRTMADTGGGNGLRTAVSEADKLFDHVLRQQGLAGDTMGDRLKSVRSRFVNREVYDHLWRAHKLRNALAHEVGFDLVPSQAREALSDFETALKTLGAL